MKDFIVALCQNRITNDRQETLQGALDQVRRAAEEGAALVALPEMFTTPYTSRSIRQNKEPLPGPTTEALSACAARNNLYIIGGSIPEETDGGLYNSTPVFDPCGNLIAVHRKMHLFDVDLPGRITYRESDLFLAGEEITVVDTSLGKIGIAICFDLRFPEVFRACVLKGCDLIAVPASFGQATGPAHWILSLRMRAIDNQCYLLGISPAANPDLPYQAYGHSALIDPWGEIIQELAADEGMIIAPVSGERVREVREEFPLLKSRKPHLYT